MLTLEIMQRRWRHGNQHVPGLLEGIVAAAPAVFEKYKLASPLVVAHFLAQASEECGEGLEMWENGNYTAERLLAVFPTHFNRSTAADAAHNAKRTLKVAYGGRMGNRPGTDDGYTYRGRGLSQVTGYGVHIRPKPDEGYAALEAFLKTQGLELDLLGNPDRVCEPEHTLECGVADWVLCGCLPFAERDDLVGETRKLNGGLNGLAERRRQLGLWKRELGVSGVPAAAASDPEPKPAPRPAATFTRPTGTERPAPPIPGMNAP